MPQCDHPNCHHTVAVPGQCGGRRCPRNAALCNHSVAIAQDVVAPPGATLAVIEADPLAAAPPDPDHDPGPIVGNGFSLTDQVPPDMVHGRDSELDLVDRAVMTAATGQDGHPRVVLFSGPTGSGKTALMRRVEHDMSDPNLPYRIDLTEIRTVAGRDLRDHIKHRLASDHGGWWSRFNHGNDDPSWTVETPQEIAGVPLPFKAKINSSIRNRIDKLSARDLPTLISHCAERSERKGGTLVLSLDAGSELDPKLLADLTSGADLAQSNGAPCVIVVSTVRNGHRQVARLGRSRYEQLVNVVRLQDLPGEDIRKVLQSGAWRSNATWDDPTMREAARWSRNNVRLAHLVGHHSVEIARSRGANRISRHDLDYAKREAFTAMAPTYRAALRRTGVDTAQRPHPEHLPGTAQVLIALDRAQTGGGRRRVTAREVAETSGMYPDVTIDRLRDLVADGLVETDGTEFRSRVPYISSYWERTLDVGVSY